MSIEKIQDLLVHGTNQQVIHIVSNQERKAFSQYKMVKLRTINN